MATTRKRKTAAKKAAPKKATAAKKASITNVPSVRVNDADIMWEELRNLPIEMFALPNQRVEDHLLRIRGVPSELYLKPKSSSALPSFETLLKGQTTIRVERTAEGDPINVSYPKYEMEETDLYIVVRRHIPPQERSELQPVAEVREDGVVVIPEKTD